MNKRNSYSFIFPFSFLRGDSDSTFVKIDFLPRGEEEEKESALFYVCILSRRMG